ncbi:MAG: AraC family transcription regulator [Comamonadaceae bacterium]|nr:MAG: AraC family transcription regulator [Comamonadaceae bacterium]
MPNPSEITNVGYKPPSDARLAVEVLSIQELRNRAPAAHFASLQRADFYRLFGVLDGHTQPMVDFSDYPAQARDWLLVRPGQVMRYDFSRPWTGWLLVFRPDGLFGSGRSQHADELNLLRHVEDLACLRSLDREQHDWMDRSLRQMQQDAALSADVSLRNEMLRLQLASTLLRLSLWQAPEAATLQSGSATWSNFKRFGQKLESDFAHQHQVQHYANVLGMSEKSLSRMCVKAVGMSAKTYIGKRLVLEAKRLLAHTTMAVQTIGHELGFDDATNFVKFFRKEVGMTPLTFRDQSRKADKNCWSSGVLG